MRKIRSGTGTSTLDDAAGAGEAAARAAAAGLEGEVPALVLVLASVRYDLPALLAGVRSVTGPAPLAGATTAGHFAGAELTEPGAGVAVLVLSGGAYRFGVGSAAGMAERPAEVGAELTRAARAAAGAGEDLPHAAVLLLTDGLGGDQQAVLTGVHRTAGATVPVVGGAAGDDRRMQATSVFHDDRVITGGAVGVWIASPRPLTVASAHGWTPVSLPQMVTRSEGLLIHEIGGRPATAVYGEHADLSAGEQLRRADGRLWQASYALGVIEPDGSHLVRGVFPSADDGPLTSFTPLPPFSAVQVVTASPQALLDVVDDVASRALVHGDEQVLLVFDCIARMDVLAGDHPEEVRRLQEAAGDATTFGFYTYGEFARTRGLGGVHNATLTAIAL